MRTLLMRFHESKGKTKVAGLSYPHRQRRATLLHVLLATTLLTLSLSNNALPGSAVGWLPSPPLLTDSLPTPVSRRIRPEPSLLPTMSVRVSTTTSHLLLLCAPSLSARV